MPVPPDVCPDCDNPVKTDSWAQPAVVRHGGYGAARRTVVRWCPNCSWTLVTAIEETR